VYFNVVYMYMVVEKLCDGTILILDNYWTISSHWSCSVWSILILDNYWTISSHWSCSVWFFDMGIPFHVVESHSFMFRFQLYI